MRISLLTIGLLVVGTVAAWAVNEATQNENHSWRYKMIVTVETPEGDVTGSAVRQMGNELQGSLLSQQGNPAEVRGEAVVIDLGERGVLFALISHLSDNEFYNAFPVPGKPIGNGGSTAEGIKYYQNLPVGTKGKINPKFFPSYPKLVTFSDIDDPKSIQLAYEWNTTFPKTEAVHNITDNLEKLFGAGVQLKEITLEITDEPVTWGKVDKYLPDIKKMVREEWDTLSRKERHRIGNLIGFKYGEEK